MDDLFLNKKQQLIRFCRNKGYVSKVDIMEWGVTNYYISADRMVRHFVQEGLMRKLPKAECSFRGLKGKMAWYEWIPTKGESGYEL